MTPPSLSTLPPQTSRYLYPDGRNHNPDLSELCQTEPHQRIHVSQVRPCPLPTHPATHTRPPHQLGLGSQHWLGSWATEYTPWPL